MKEAALASDDQSLEPVAERRYDTDLTEVGGEPVCWLSRVCPDCGRLLDDEPPADSCPVCGADLSA